MAYVVDKEYISLKLPWWLDFLSFWLYNMYTAVSGLHSTGPESLENTKEADNTESHKSFCQEGSV